MKKRPLGILAAVLLALAVAFVGSSWYAGWLVQRDIESWVAQANQHLASEWPVKAVHPRLEVVQYRRGLFSSSIDYRLDVPTRRQTIESLSLHDDLEHGPWPWSALRAGTWTPLVALSHLRPRSGNPWQPWFDAVPKGQLPWTLTSRIGVDGKVSAVLALAPVHAAAAGLDFSGGHLNLHYDAQTHQFALDGTLPSLVLDDATEKTRFSLQGIHVDSHTIYGARTDLQGHQKIHFDQVDVMVPGMDVVTFVKPQLALDLARTGSLLNDRVHGDLGQVRLGQRDLGQIQATLSMDGLNVPALQSAVLALDQIAQDIPEGQGVTDAQLREVRRLLLPIMAAAPRVTLDTLRWRTAGGQSELQAQASFQPVAEDAPDDLGGAIESALQQLTARLRVSKPMVLDLLRQAQGGTDGVARTRDGTVTALASMLFDRYASRLERLGLIKREQDQVVTTDLAYAGGRVTVNGRRMSLPAFIERLRSAPGLGKR